ncbi:hypothetical protein ALC62_05847 [Cyphomyrmex costatus]|uniref:Uncharacterized protein n=1 Tax=Cyphomyrmex costatus TaxID=456900 RepID=A0A151K2E1_9HYME|nr:hypothetical protein ALC62_05847 [Cyphomyrmex costatus]
MIWFVSLTINLGPIFINGAFLSINMENSYYKHEPICPLIHGHFNNYIINVCWVATNIALMLTYFPLSKLHKKLTTIN